MKQYSPEKKDFIRAFRFPFLLLCVLWSIKVIEWISNNSFGYLGIYPHRVKGLFGILFAPLLHSDFIHLLNNSVPLFVLTGVLIYFYKPVAIQILLLIWGVTGLCVWIGGREAYHIGASGLIYGLASFLFFSGVFLKKVKLLAISLVVSFLYGSMVWGIFPLYADVSWESHLFGLLSGLLFAYVYSKDTDIHETQEVTEDPSDDDPYWEVEDIETSTKIPD